MDLVEINGVAIANVAKVDNIEDSDIVDINNIGVPVLLADSLVVGSSDLPLTNTSSGNRKSTLQASTPSYQNLVDTDLTNWTNTLGTVTVSEPEANVYRLVVSNPGTTSTLDFDLTTASTDRVAAFDIRRVSGTGVDGDFVAFTDGNTVRGDTTKFDMPDITDEWTSETALVTSAEQTNRLRFRFGGETTITIEVRLMRATNTTEAAPAFPDGTGAGYITDATNIRATNIVDTDLSNAVSWKGGAVIPGQEITVTEPEPYVYRLSVNSTEATVLKCQLPADLSIDRAAACEARIASGSLTDNSNHKLSWRNGTTFVGTGTELRTLTSDWQRITATVSDGTASTELTFKVDTGTNVCEIDVRLMRATDTVDPVEAFPDGTGEGYTKVDKIESGAAVIVSSMAGATNLVDTDLTNWGEGGATADIEATPNGDGSFDITFAGNGSASTLEFSLTALSVDRSGRCEAKLISGNIASPDSYISFRDITSVQKGTKYETSNLTSDWQVVDWSVTSADQSAFCTVRFDSSESGEIVIRVRNIRAVSLSAPVAAFTDGSADDEVYGTDLLEAEMYDNEVSTDIANWGVAWSTDNIATKEDMGSGVFEFELDASVGGSWGALISQSFVTKAATTYSFAFEARLISGDPVDLEARVVEGSPFERWISIDLSDLSTGWTEYSGTGTADDTDGKCQFINNGGESKNVKIQVRKIRVTETSSVIPFNRVWPEAGTILHAGVTYGYSGNGNPINAAARFWEPGGTGTLALTPGSASIMGIGTGGSVSENTAFTMSGDWDGAEHGARWDTDARLTAANTTIPTTEIAIGNNKVSGIRPFHGLSITLIVNRKASDVEYSVFRTWALGILNALLAEGLK